MRKRRPKLIDGMRYRVVSTMSPNLNLGLIFNPGDLATIILDQQRPGHVILRSGFYTNFSCKEDVFHDIVSGGMLHKERSYTYLTWMGIVWRLTFPQCVEYMRAYARGADVDLSKYGLRLTSRTAHDYESINVTDFTRPLAEQWLAMHLGAVPQLVACKCCDGAGGCRTPQGHRSCISCNGFGYRKEDQEDSLIRSKVPTRSGIYWYRDEKPGSTWFLKNLNLSAKIRPGPLYPGQWIDPLDERHLKNMEIVDQIRDLVAKQEDPVTKLEAIAHLLR